MLKLYPSNRLERLAERLAAVTAEPLHDPFAPELIVTQSLGTAHWLSLQLAARHGIAANLRFMLPAALVWDLFRRQADEPLPERSLFDRTALAWRIFDRLRQHLAKPSFAPLRAYLSGDHPELKRYQLACRVADLFDQYLVFRTDLIERWDHGAEPDDWQAELWRDLSTSVAEPHRVILLRRFLARCAAGKLDVDALPERISVFGLSTLPPAHLEVLARVAELIDVHVFFFNPCKEYWGDLQDERTAARRRRWRKPDCPSARPGDPDHPLLASLGQQGRDFFQRLLDVPAVEPLEGDELFVEPGEATLLARLQSDILNLAHRGAEDGKALPNPGDESVRIHVCHSPMREIEVLHDRLLALFDRHPDLEPRDVIVMVPAIETYAPCIEAVFAVGDAGQPAEGRAPRLPCSIADRPAHTEHPVLHAFLRLLQLPASRLKASEVLGLLQTPAIRQRYRLGEDEFERVHRWVRESGIRWGLDRRHREEFHLPGLTAHSWDFGLDRLFLGYAMDDSGDLYGDLAPFEDVEGQAAEALGKLQSFLEDLARCRAELRDSLTPRAWAERLNALFDRFFAVSEESARAAQTVREVLSALDDETRFARCEATLHPDVVRQWIQERLTEPTPAQRFHVGRITFCSMLPMRSLPFRIVCLLGMNDTDFPRRRKPPGFDRIAADPKPGDRSRREDDRYLFLEALLSAREYFHLGYVGRNIRDNSELLPSVVVGELLDHIDRIAESPAAKKLSDHLKIEHPMQPFGTRYFAADSDLFSYAAEWVTASERLQGPRPGGVPFAATPIGDPEDAFHQVQIDHLVRFYRNPARYFLEQRLLLFLDEEDDTPEDSEPFALDGLQHYAIKQELIGARLAGNEAMDSGRRFSARGLLPEVPFDRLTLDTDRQEVAALWLKLQQYPAYLEPAPEPSAVDRELAPFRLYGALRDLRAPGLLVCRPAKVKAKDRLSLWLRHLALHAAENRAGTGLLVAADKDMLLPPIAPETARAHLKSLLEYYWQGLSAPLPFCPETSFAYAAKMLRTGQPAEALKDALKAWEGTMRLPGEKVDPAYRLAFPDGLPPFADIALAVFQPMIESSGT